MINLKNFKYLYITYCIFTILFLSISSKLYSAENKILFKIGDRAFTSFDYEMRVRYLDFVGSNNNLSYEIIINDFISANLFFQYYKYSNNKTNYDKKIIEIYQNIKKTNEDANKKYNYDLNEKNIINNIKLDYIRKIILEKILNSNLSNLKKSEEEIDLLYNLKIKYINFKYINKNEFIKNIKDFNKVNIDVVKSYLQNNKIEYFIKEKEINNIKQIDKRIRDNILLNKTFFTLEDKNTFTLVFIEKKFETLDGINTLLYSLKTKNEVSTEILYCENLMNDKNNPNITYKEYKFSDLNNELKNNLININDYVKFYNNNEHIYVILCNISFDTDLLENINLNKLINSNVSEIEKNFIKKYSKIFNLIVNNV